MDKLLTGSTEDPLNQYNGYCGERIYNKEDETKNDIDKLDDQIKDIFNRALVHKIWEITSDSSLTKLEELKQYIVECSDGLYIVENTDINNINDFKTSKIVLQDLEKIIQEYEAWKERVDNIENSDTTKNDNDLKIRYETLKNEIKEIQSNYNDTDKKTVLDQKQKLLDKLKNALKIKSAPLNEIKATLEIAFYDLIKVYEVNIQDAIDKGHEEYRQSINNETEVNDTLNELDIEEDFGLRTRSGE